MTPARARAVLDERARLLAVAVDSAGQAAEEIEVITFQLSRERYAIESSYVREVVRYTDFTPVPGGPKHLFGVTNLRGEILAIFDLRELLAIPQRTISDLFRVMVLGKERAEFGILADAVEEVRTIATDRLSQPSEGLGASDLMRGMTEDAMVVLDGAGMLASERFCMGQNA